MDKMKNSIIFLQGFLLVFSLLTINLYASGASEPCSDDSITCGVDDTADGSDIKAPGDAEPFREPIHTQITQGKIYLYLFYTFDCPRCEELHKVLSELKAKTPELEIQQFEIKKNHRNREYFEKILSDYRMKLLGVPTIVIGGTVHAGYYKNETEKFIVDEISRQKGSGETSSENVLDIPIIGLTDIHAISLPAFTIYIGLLDGLNPCAIWVLTFLLGLLVYSQDRRKILLVGLIFVVSSAVIYFIFMTAWLNLFLVIGYSRIVTISLGIAAIAMGLVNIKELFFFKKGVSLMIPEAAKPKLYRKMRSVIHQKSRTLLVLGTITLAVFVNFIVLGCTIGLPAIYTKILTMRNLPKHTEYFYLGLYNIAYVVPLAVVVGVFVFTLGHYKITQKHAILLKAVSGSIMLLMGLALLFSPKMFTL